MSDLFPLPLAPLESYILADARPGYRWCFLVEQSFDGEIDRAAFEAGIADACHRHPLFRALVQRRLFRGWQWVSAGDRHPTVDWASIDDPMDFPDDMGIDLSREVGVRFFVRVGHGESRLVTLFHHACCDGMGAIQFLSDLFTTYTRALHPDAVNPVTYQPVEARQLLRRADLRVHHDQTMPWIRLFLRTIAYAWKYGVHSPLPLAPARTSSGAKTPLQVPGTMTRTLSPAVHFSLKQAARQHAVTVNELLVRELLLTIRDWNQRHSNVRDSDQISVMVPTNLRNMDHDQMPAANVMGVVFFQRSVAELQQPQKLLESIKQESQFYKRWRFGAAFLGGLKILLAIPGSLRLVLDRQRSTTSAFLSCLGDPSLAISTDFPVNDDGNPIFGNLVFKDMNTAPPFRPLTHAAFTTWHFSNKLRLGVRCDATVFTQESAQALLDSFTERVIDVANAATERRQAARVAA